MLASPFILYQRLGELRPSEDEHRIARWLRDGNSAIAPKGASTDAGRRLAVGVRASQPTRQPAR
jgi:hypothetical protein